MSKELGAIYTPQAYARILTTWAIQAKTDTVLDMGVGPGIFVYQAYDRLINLGASSESATNQLYGSEINKIVFDAFTDKSVEMGLKFNHILNIDYFKSSFPQLDAIVGNPPYVRRRGMDSNILDNIRIKTLADNPEINIKDLYALSDLYIYFLLSALPSLKEGGRLATIIADTWLNTRYGLVLKKYLLKEFDVHQIISLDRSIFEDAQVKAVLLFATKRKSTLAIDTSIRFARVRNGLSTTKLSSFISKQRAVSDKDIFVTTISTSSLDFKSPWGAIFKATSLFGEITKNMAVKPMRAIGNVHIGIESLAKDFFVVSAEQKKQHVVESKYLRPFVYSIYDFESPVITEDDETKQFIFYCDKSKKKLAHTHALKYIQAGERTKTSIRGTNQTVIGYHKKARIIKANRPRWYDIKTGCKRKPIGEILIPRFIYKEYLVLWNVAKYIPGGATVQFFPKPTPSKQTVDIKVYLAILTSSFTEIAFRISAQVYGGGTSNLSITTMKDTPIVDVNQLSAEQSKALIIAYDQFLKTTDKALINQTVYTILGLSKRKVAEMDRLLKELRHMAESAKKAAHPKRKKYPKKG